VTHTNSSQLDKQKKRDFLPKGKSGRVVMKWHISFHNETIISENDELENKFSYQPYHLLWLTTTNSLQSSKPLQPFTPFLVKSSKCTPVSDPINSSQPDYQHKHYSGLDIRQVVFIFLLF